ncbi:integrin-linked protein kinase 1-like [Hibiscus syriacus]|uniref:integrin-linked protein kinase 1-like n=1 Tax=Hibiscus syriacus TaxID=106335 RepID=UPI0019206844|nr:integrin-linked protein kinase 1-like [Hibiscus syriacus]
MDSIHRSPSEDGLMVLENMDSTMQLLQRSDGVTKGSYQVAKWNGTKVSAKILDKNSFLDPETINAFKYELTLLEKVLHPILVQFFGAVTLNIPMMFVSKYQSSGDLRCYLRTKGRSSPHKASNFALNIASGMNYLHDYKSDTIIFGHLSPEYEGQLKVAGFGLLRLSYISYNKAKLMEEHIDPSSEFIFILV